MPREFVPAFAVLLLAQFVAAQNCAPQGVSVAATGGRLGDAWRIDAFASPSVLGVFGLDLAPGPVPTPFGTICLGLTPSLQLAAFLTDPSGAASNGGALPPSPVFVGITIHATAITFDPSLPGGIGIGNDASFTLRQPRFWFVSPGSATPFGTTPGAIAATNGITDDVAFAQSLTTAVRDAATVPERGWLVTLLGNGSLAAWDGVSPTPVMNLTLAGAAAQAIAVLALPAGEQLLLLTPGSPAGPFGGGSPGSVHIVQLPSGTVNSVPLPSGNPTAMLHVPGTTLVFLRTGDAVVPFEVGSATALPQVSLPSGFGPFADWQHAGGQLYCLHAGQTAGPFSTGQPPAISVIDVGTLSLFTTTPLAMLQPVHWLRVGPGMSGPAVFAYGAAGVLEEFAQGSLQPVSSLALGGGIAAMELSSLGTQWLLLCTGTACGGSSLLQLIPGILVVPLQPLSAPQPALGVSPSAGHGKAALVLGTNVAGPFGTDPFTGVVNTLLPMGASTWWIRAD